MKYQKILIGCILIFRFSRIPYIPQKTSNTPYPENNREKLKHPSHFKFCVFLEFFKSNPGLQSINRKGKSSQKPNLWKNLPAWQEDFRQRIAMTNELSNRVEQNHCSGQCACKPSTKKLVDMSSNNNMIILVAVLITTASAIGLYVYLDTNSSEPINPQTGMLASEHRAPSSTVQGTASVSMEELLEKTKQVVFSYSREGNFPDTRARLKIPSTIKP